MQPFIAADANTFGSLIASTPDPLRAMQEQIAFKVGLDAKKAEAAFQQAQVGAQAMKVQRQAQFQTAMQGYLANPTAQGLAQLMGAFPEYADEAKTAFNALDGDRKQTELTQAGEVAALASAGKYDQAASVMRGRVEADKAVGHSDPMDEQILSMLDSGDPVQQKKAVGLIAYGLGAAVGPEHAGSYLKVLGLSQEPDLVNVAPGADVIDARNPEGGAVYSSPYRPSTITDPSTGQVFQVVPKGGQGGGSATPAPKAGPVDLQAASTLGSQFGTVTSTTRSAKHNKEVGGVPNSYHLSGHAIDIARKPGVKHGQIVQAYRNAGYTILEQLDEGDHSHIAVDGGPSSGPPRVRSVQEAMKLPKGTRFIDPNGVERIR